MVQNNTTKEPWKLSLNMLPTDYHLFPALEEYFGGPNLKMCARYRQFDMTADKTGQRLLSTGPRKANIC